MVTFRVHLKKARKPNQPRLMFDLEKLSDPDMACTFQATIGGKFTSLIGLSDEDMDIDTMITTYNTEVTDAASEILWKECRRKKPWVTKDVLDLCYERRVLKKNRYKAEKSKRIQGNKQEDSEGSKESKGGLDRCSVRGDYNLPEQKQQQESISSVVDLTSEKQSRFSTVQDKSWKCLTEENEILSRWTEYCSELYNYESFGDNAVLDCSQPQEEDLQPILREEVEIAVASLKKGKSSGVDKLAGRP